MPFELIPDTSVPGIIICAPSVIRLEIREVSRNHYPEWSLVFLPRVFLILCYDEIPLFSHLWLKSHDSLRFYRSLALISIILILLRSLNGDRVESKADLILKESKEEYRTGPGKVSCLVCCPKRYAIAHRSTKQKELDGDRQALSAILLSL